MTRTRSACAINGDHVTVNVTCHLCDTLVTRGAESAEWEVRWLSKCSESLAQLIDIEDFGPAFFDAGHYCKACMTLIRDVDFSVRASASLASRLLSLRTQIAAFLLSRLSVKAESKGEISQSEGVSEEVVKMEGIEKESLDFSSISEPLIGSKTADHESGEIDTESGEKAVEEAHASETVLSSTRVLRCRTMVSYRVDDGISKVGSDREAEADNDWSIPSDDDSDWSIPNENDGDWSIPNDMESKSTEAVTEGTKPKPNPCMKRANHESIRLGNRAKRLKTTKPNSKPTSSRFGVRTQTKITSLAEKAFIARMKSTNRYCVAPTELESTLHEFVRKNFDPVIFTGHVTEALLVHLLHSEVEEHNQSLKTYICAAGACHARFCDQGGLRRHQAQAHGENFDGVPFQCFLCPTRFSIAAQLNAHIRQKHEGDSLPHHCEVSGCTATFHKATGLVYHTRRRHPEFVSKFGFGMIRSKYYKYRDTVAMSQEPFRRVGNSGKIKTGSLTFACSEPGCTYRTNTERFLGFHTLDHHPSSAKVGSARPYLCDLCGKGFKNQYTYNNHHCVNPVQHKCDECGEGFAVPLRLANHMKLKHAHAQLYKCSVCHCAYARTEDVQRHEKLHIKVTGFNCVLKSCPTRHFESLEDLRTHVTGPVHDIAQRSRGEKAVEAVYASETVLPSTRFLRSRTKVSYRVDDGISEVGSDREADDDWSIPNENDGDWLIPSDIETNPTEEVTEDTSPTPNMKRTNHESAQLGSGAKRPKISAKPNSRANRSAVRTQAKLTGLAEKEFIARMKATSRYFDAPKELESTLTEFVRKHFDPIIFEGHVTQALLVYLLHTELEEHNQSTKTYICATGACPARFRDSVGLWRHQAQAHGEYFDSAPFQCFLCPKRFSIAPRLNAHIRQKHEGDSLPHRCEVSGCTATYHKENSLFYHTRRRHPEFVTEFGFGTVRSKFYKYRDTVAMSQESFRRGKVYPNKTGSRTFVCTEPGCTYRTNTEQFLGFHTLDEHPTSAKVGSARPYLCDLCGKGFKKRLDYNKHPCVNPAQPKCDECGEEFTIPLHLANHKKLKHAHAQLHKCSVCHCAYARTEDVQRHEKLHNEVTGFNCVLSSCPTRHFESLEDLRAHVTGLDHDIAQRSLVCDICGKVYKGVRATGLLRQHKYSHGDGGPFKCRFCGKGHRIKSAQVTHEEINHPDLAEKRIYACKLCDATFTVYQYLHKHIAWHRHGSNANRPIAKKRY